MLCNHCNVGVGMLKEDPVLLDNAKTYLRERTDWNKFQEQFGPLGKLQKGPLG